MKTICIILILLAMVPVYGQEGICDIKGHTDSTSLGDSIGMAMASGLDTTTGLMVRWAIADSMVNMAPIATPTDTVEIFYLDTLDFYIDTTQVAVDCPDGYIGCLVYHFAPKLEIKAKTQRVTVLKFKAPDFNRLKDWQMERVVK